jgi:hypothetical protein
MDLGQIDKYPTSIVTNLKTLRMRRQSKIGSPACLRDVDDGERPVAVPIKRRLASASKRMLSASLPSSIVPAGV